MKYWLDKKVLKLSKIRNYSIKKTDLTVLKSILL